MFLLPDLNEIPHLYSSPLGRVWRLEAEELGLQDTLYSHFLVRRLPASGSFLTTSAMLGLAATTESRVGRPATHWLQDKGGVYIATPSTPHQVPILESSAPLTFHDAVESWRPIALAVQHCHSKGLTHGNVNPWSVHRDRELILLDAGTWIADAPGVSQWWPQSVRRAESHLRECGTKDDVLNLARLLVWLTRPGDPEAATSLEHLPAWAIAPLASVLNHDGHITRVSDLLKALAPAPILSESNTEATNSVLFARVSHVEDIQHPTKGPGIKFWLLHPRPEAENSATRAQGAFFYKASHGDVYNSIAHIWEGAEVNILDALEVEDSKGRIFLSAKPETLPVIEPHWPVTVTNVLKADGCVSRMLVDTREDELPNIHLIFGSLVHEFLEYTRRDPDLDFYSLWEQVLPRYRVGLLAAGLGESDMEKFEEDARAHFNNIVAFARGRSRERSVENPTWTGDYVEVSRYSSIFGLEGRIDLVTEHERDGLQIVELKTGSAREEHLTQLRSYKLLWDPLVQEQKKEVSGYLLYSKDASMRSAPLEDPMRERRLLRARNALVAWHRSSARDPSIIPQYFMEVPEDCNARACRWRKETCKRQTAILGFGQVEPEPKTWKGFEPELVARAQTWWAHFNHLLEMENWVEGEELGLMLQTGRLRERIDGFRAAPGLELGGFDRASGRVNFTGDHRNIFHIGQTVIAHRNDFHGSHIVRAQVESIGPNHIELATQGMPAPEQLPRSNWILDVLPMRIGYRSAQRSIYRILDQQRTEIFEALFRPESAQAASLMEADDCDDTLVTLDVELNADQMNAVVHGLNAPVGALIQGPPGTGKTTVIAHLAHELARQGQYVLVAAQTNTAVDTMLSRILDVGWVDFIRVGTPERHPQLAARLTARGLEADEYFSDSLGQVTPKLEQLKRRLLEAPITGVTAHRAASSDLMSIATRARGPVPWDVVIVDEATQLTEPMTLAAISRAKRFILVGDHRQLPPVVRHESLMTPFHEELSRQRMSSNAPQLDLFGAPVVQERPMELRGLDQSLFERLINAGLSYTMLREQYRMNEEIMAFSNRHFYDSELLAHPSVAKRRLEIEESSPSPILAPNNPVVFVNVEPSEVTQGRDNPDEAKASAELVEAMIQAGVEPSEIGVISPFRAQVHAIRKLLFERQIADVDVDTVERYQGSERDVILVSLVKTERAGEFISDARRLNVTLTRARKKLIILGYRSCLIGDPLMRALIEQDETLCVDWPQQS